MRRMVFGFLVVALAGFGGGTASAAGVDAAKVAAVKKAASDFTALAKGSETSGQPPRESDPKVKALLDVVFDTSVLNTSQPLPASELGNVNEWMLQVLTVGTVYYFAGTGYTDFSKVAGLDQAAQEKLQQQINKNVAAFAPEMGRYLDAQLQVMEGLIWCVSTDLAAHPDNYKSTQSQHGLGQVRSGLTTTLVGVLTTLPIDGLSDEWRRARLPALSAIEPKAAAFLLPDQRASLHDVAAQVAGQMTDPAVKSGLTDFAQKIGG
jgi:hypothetical protein